MSAKNQHRKKQKIIRRLMTVIYLHENLKAGSQSDTKQKTNERGANEML